jgi:hypothetical protein
MESTNLPLIAVDILSHILPTNAQVSWHIVTSPDGHVEAAFRWKNCSSNLNPPPRHITHQSRNLKRKSPSQRRRDRRRLESFLARNKSATTPHTHLETALGNPNSNHGDCGSPPVAVAPITGYPSENPGAVTSSDPSVFLTTGNSEEIVHIVHCAVETSIVHGEPLTPDPTDLSSSSDSLQNQPHTQNLLLSADTLDQALPKLSPEELQIIYNSLTEDCNQKERELQTVVALQQYLINQIQQPNLD